MSMQIHVHILHPSCRIGQMHQLLTVLTNIQRLYKLSKYADVELQTCLLHHFWVDCATCGIEHVLLYFRNQDFSNLNMDLNLP